MSDFMHSNITLAEAATLIRQRQRFILTTHAKPDGDAFGAVIALAAALKHMGKTVYACFAPPVPACFQSLLGADLYALYDSHRPWPQADLTILLDTCAWAQVSPMRAELEKRVDQLMILDHHQTGDMSPAWCFVDNHREAWGAAATCEVVAQLLDLFPDAQNLYSPTVCQALFTGIAQDTGWFRFSNTRPFTHQLAARLQLAGVDHADLYQKLEQTERPAKVALLGRALRNMRFLAGDRVALMVLRASDFAETGALWEETERFVDYPQMAGCVRVVILITEPPLNHTAPSDKLIRISFRSKPGPNAINVAELAGHFGGGGHARASGAKLTGTVDQAIAKMTTIADSIFAGDP